jgi:hypothetical protein
MQMRSLGEQQIKSDDIKVNSFRKDEFGNFEKIARRKHQRG